LTVIATLKDGRVIAKAVLTEKVVSATTDTALDPATITDLKQIEYILQFNLTTDPDTYVIPHDASIDGNVVGVTVYAGAGTTVGGEVIAIGF